MRIHALILASLLGLAGCNAPSTTPASPTAAPPPKTATAASIKPADELEAALLKPPINADALAEHARFLSTKAGAETDAAKAKSLRRHAYEFAAAADAAGSKDLLLPMLLAAIRPDGSVVAAVHSPDAKINQLVTDGEARFARGDMDGALRAYQAAFDLDPHCYRAALFAGDVFFSRKEYAGAVSWFDRAIAIDPDMETAHRYRADSLMHLRRFDEAGVGYLNAFIDAPFAPIPTTALNRWIATRNIKLEPVDTSFVQGGIRIENGKVTLLLNPEKSDVLSIAYAVSRAKYVEDHKVAAKDYRHTVAEEVAAWRALLQIAAELKQNAPETAEIKKHEATLELLRDLDRDSLLEAFVFYDRADSDIAKDYAAYRTQHRDLLLRYLSKVWLKLP